MTEEREKRLALLLEDLEAVGKEKSDAAKAYNERIKEIELKIRALRFEILSGQGGLAFDGDGED